MLVELLNEQVIEINLDVKTKSKTVRRLVELAHNSGKIRNIEEVIKKIMTRERFLSTGVGKGVAIPRACSEFIEDFCFSFIITKEPIDFESLDNAKVRILMFCGIPHNRVRESVEYMVRIFRLFNQDSFRASLFKAKNAKEVIKIFKKEEKDLDITS